jgi:hypothetical protein
MRWVGHVERMGKKERERDVDWVLVKKREGHIPHGHYTRGKIILKTDLQDKG